MGKDSNNGQTLPTCPDKTPTCLDLMSDMIQGLEIEEVSSTRTRSTKYVYYLPVTRVLSIALYSISRWMNAMLINSSFREERCNRSHTGNLVYTFLSA